MGPPFSISEANRSSNFSFKHQEYCLLRVFSNYTNQKFHDFYRISTIFGQFTAVFHFFLLRRGSRSLYVEPSEKIRYLTLDLVKSFLLWTIRKKATMNQILTVRLLAEFWTYWTSPLKQEKHSYKWSTNEYNSINSGTSENIL